MLKAKQEGKVRHIGFSGHTTPKAHVHLLDRTDEMEAVMMPINVADPSYNSFIVNVLPKLQEKNIGVIAMKTLAGGAFFGRGFEGRHQADDTVMSHISVQEAIHFALSIPNHTLVTGPKDPDMLQEKIDFIHSFKKMNQKTRKQLIDKVAHISKGGIEYYKGIP
jgi:predicted aldo/keto reductase-like oxidoreductase